MPAQGSYGAIALPVVVPTSGQPVGDPALYYLGSYLQAVVNAIGTATWQSLVPTQGGTGLPSMPIMKVFFHNPEELSIDETYFPALFLYREEGEAEHIADDYRVSKDTIHLVWIWTTAAQENARKRHAFVNAMTKAIDAALTVERDPSWVVTGDADPDAARLGSLIYTWASLFRMDLVAKWKLQPVTVMKGTARTTYHALTRTLAIQELLTETGFDAFTGVELSLETTDAPPYDLVDLNLPTPT